MTDQSSQESSPSKVYLGADCGRGSVALPFACGMWAMPAGAGVDTGFGFSIGAGSLAPLKMYAKLRSRNDTTSFS